MRYLLLLLVVLALPAQARTITDSAGRVVEIPDEVNTVFAAGPPASILVYIMKPEATILPRLIATFPKQGVSPGAAVKLTLSVSWRSSPI